VVAGEGPGDGEVVRAVLAGDVEQYAVLVRRYRDRFARFAAHMLGSVDAAEDAVQDTLIRAYEQLRSCRDPDKFAGWFFLILRNRCLAERRRTKHSVTLGEVMEQADPRRVDRAVESQEERRLLADAVAELTPEQREVFLLKHMEGWSYQEIAAYTGLPVDSLKMRMHRAYQRLRVSLRPMWDGTT
jgi:RNA polymerase sigma-70 factor (ECF subfamily)